MERSFRVQLRRRASRAAHKPERARRLASSRSRAPSMREESTPRGRPVSAASEPARQVALVTCGGGPSYRHAHASNGRFGAFAAGNGAPALSAPTWLQPRFPLVNALIHELIRLERQEALAARGSPYVRQQSRRTGRKGR